LTYPLIIDYLFLQILGVDRAFLGFWVQTVNFWDFECRFSIWALLGADHQFRRFWVQTVNFGDSQGWKHKV